MLCLCFVEKYFDMNKKQCRDALDLYKKFLIRMDRVGEFLKVAENVGIDKGEIPDLTKVCFINIIICIIFFLLIFYCIFLGTK